MEKAKKVFFIVPGFKEQVSDKQYQWLVSYIKKGGWKVAIIPVHWNHRTLSQNTVDFTEFYNQHKSTTNYILGFSFGAVITLLTAQTLKPQKIFLCSLSPYFAEDRELMAPWLKKWIGKRRYLDILNRSGVALARNLSIPTTVFYGEVEGNKFPSLKKRCEETAKLAKHAKLIVVPNAPHQIDFKEYKAAIISVLNF